MKVFRKILLVLFLVLMSILLLIIGQGYSMYQNAISETPLEEKVSQIRQKENFTPIAIMPKMYQNAVISVEDHRFEEHSGIDFIAIGRAIINNIKALDLVEGGSTITQQLAKNMYFTQEKKFTRKIAEVFTAFDLEKKYSKQEILELYLNTCYFGNGYYSVSEACLGYFGKKVQDMTDAECVLLAGIPNAPSVYSPYENLELAKQRQHQVLHSMVQNGYLTQEQADTIASDNSVFSRFENS